MERLIYLTIHGKRIYTDGYNSFLNDDMGDSQLSLGPLELKYLSTDRLESLEKLHPTQILSRYYAHDSDPPSQNSQPAFSLGLDQTNKKDEEIQQSQAHGTSIQQPQDKVCTSNIQ
ncbi:hypothetical protein MKX01_021303 [Papaver californicum]|nr:hypothetical protein MKX01_021303 [Papaver californicum]